MDDNLKFMWKGRGCQLKGSLSMWAVIWEDAIFILNSAAKWWGHRGAHSCRCEEKLIEVLTVKKWGWGAEQCENTGAYSMNPACALKSLSVLGKDVKPFLGVLEWFNPYDSSHTCKKYKEMLGGQHKFLLELLLSEVNEIKCVANFFLLPCSVLSLLC